MKQESITSQKRGSGGFWGIANSVLNKGKFAILPLFNDLEVLSTRAVALDISKAFDRLLLVFFTNASLTEFQLRYLALFLPFSVIDSFRWFWMGYPVNAGVPQGFILDATLFLLYIIEFPDDVICNVAFYVDDTTLYSTSEQASDLLEKLELASELDLIYKTLD